MTNFNVVPVNWLAFAEHWQQIEPMLESAMVCASRRYLPIDILAALIVGNGQGWFVREGDEIRAVLITRLDQHPRAKCCTIFALAGDRMAEWFDLAESTLTEYARRNGCTQFECQGRRGWERVLDLEPRSVLYVKEIDGGANVDGR